MTWWLDSQPLVAGAVLVWASGTKLLSRQASATVARSALPRLVGPRHALPLYRALGVAELAVGAALLAPPLWWPEPAAAVALATGFLAYLCYSRVTAPSASCGCMGTRQAPIGIRTFGRAGLLLLACAASLFTSAATLHPALVLELAVIAALSPEWDAYWLIPLRRLKVRLLRPPRAVPGRVPIAVTVAQLHQTGVYRQVSRLITSDVRDHWDDGQWRIICYSARFRGDDVSAVFAVPGRRFDPNAVRVALVNEFTGATVFSLESGLEDRLPLI